jgi:TonB family protein
MNPPPSSITALFAHAAGWTLLHFLWQGALVALILACVLALLSGRSAQPRYLAACAALVLMAILPLITFARIVAAEHSAANTFLISIPLSITVTGHGIATPAEPLLYRIAMALDRSMPTVLAVWLAGVVLLFLRLGIGLIIARRMMSASTQSPPRDLLRVFHRLARLIEVTRPVRLLNSALVQVPAVIGWLRPVVLIPLGCLSGLSPIQVEAILAHELAHIRRHDYLVSVLQSIVEALLFYHPAVWWVSRHIRREREHCCDDLAVQYTGDALTYARALSLLEEHRSALPAIALGANGGILTMRIKRLLGSKESVAAPQLVALTLLGIVIAATGVCVTTAARAQNNPTQLQQPQYNPPAVTIATKDIRGPQLLASNPPAPASRPQAANETPSSPAIAPHNSQPQNIEKPTVRNISNRPTTAPQQESAQPPVRVSAGVMAGQVLTRVNPIYPAEAKANHVEGPIVLHAVISKTGEVRDLDVVSGPDDLRTSAIDAIQQWTYRPYLLNGEPTEVETTITVNYKLEDPADSQSPNDESASGVVPKKIGGGVSAPVLIYSVPPEYSEQAKKEKVGGTVLVNFWVDEQGRTKHVRVLRGVGDGLDEKALEAVKQYKFSPAMEGGKPVLVELKTEVNFKIF